MLDQGLASEQLITSEASYKAAHLETESALCLLEADVAPNALYMESPKDNTHGFIEASVQLPFYLN